MDLILDKFVNTENPLLKFCTLSFDPFRIGYLMSQQKNLFWFSVQSTKAGLVT